MFDLRKLWANRLFVLIGNLVAGEQEHREIANLAQHIGADYHGRFLLELLQNAGDQATKAGLRESAVMIVRTPDLVAVANQGAPFDEDGIRAITSLGVSPKDPRFAIGNKGVGFKAVFQITSAPEIYSASSSTTSFLDGSGGDRFSLCQGPLEIHALESELRELTRVHLIEHPEWARTLCERYARNSDPVDIVLAEARRAAPFKFPLPLDGETLVRRLAEFGLIAKDVSAFQTLVVLPLLRDEGIAQVIDRAVAELTAGAATSLLFLPGVARIVLLDRTHKMEHELGRHMVGAAEELPRGVCVWKLQTSTSRRLAAGEKPAEQLWWCASRELGKDSPEERLAIQRAAGRLPGTNWHAVDSAVVTIALPVPSDGSLPGASLGANGRISIGLPTHDRTGAPFWVDAHFHGTISRTGIDLIDNEYNRLLFTESVRLVGDLLGHLKADPALATRRLVTLAMETAAGPLADALNAEGGLAHTAVVLDAGGSGYLKGSDMALPAVEDMPLFGLLAEATPDLRQYGFRLAEQALLTSARPLLDRLAAQGGSSPRHRAVFLRRPPGSLSLLERAAMHHRAAGRDFWHRFLEWVLRFPIEELQKQRILPVGENELETPAAKVFLRPAVSRGLGDSDEDEPTMLHEHIQKALRFLDEAAVEVRDEQGRTLTALARKLAPEAGQGLVRRPRRVDLINDALAPRLREASQAESQKRTALSLLEHAVDWIMQLSDAALAQIRLHELCVPTREASGTWKWLAPASVYLGIGWQEGKTDELLARAYAHEPQRQLVPWDEFARAAECEPEKRSWWVQGLGLLGVSSALKVRLLPKRSRPPLVSWSKRELMRDPHTPSLDPALYEYWTRYLDEIRHRESRTASGQGFDVRELTWIDGLERQEVRPAIVEMVLINPHLYEPFLETMLERSDGRGDETRVDSLWVNALRMSEWAVIPTSLGPRAAGRAWWLEADERRLQQDRYSHLGCVPSAFTPARRVLEQLGVTTLGEAYVGRLIDALLDLATAVSQLDPSQQRGALALASELYGRLQSRLADGAEAAHLGRLAERLIPVQKGRDLYAVDARTVEVIYIHDDPVRARFIPGIEDAFRLPLPARSAYAKLHEALTGVLGTGRVRRTSEEPIETGFIASPAGSGVRLLDYVREQFAGRSVAVDLGLLVAFGGREVAATAGREFRETWSRLARATVQFGAFPSGFASSCFFDQHDSLLMVSDSLDSFDVLESSWAIVGPSFRDLWAAYARDLKSGRTAAFFSDRQIGPAERQDVEIAIGAAPEESLSTVRAAILALWRRTHTNSPVEDFHREWKLHATSASALASWVNAPGLAVVLKQLRGLPEDEASLQVMAAVSLTPADWQKARGEIGQPPWDFPASAALHSEGAKILAAGLMSLAAHSTRVNLDTARQLVETIRSAKAEAVLVQQPPDDVTAAASILRIAHMFLTNLDEPEDLALLVDRLRALSASSPPVVAGLLPDGAVKREVELYRHEPEDRRTAAAGEVVEAILRVATALASACGEFLDAEAIRAQPRVQALRAGWWANRFAVLGAMQQALSRAVPHTAHALSEARGFHDPMPWQQLWAALPQLGPVPSAAPAQRAERQISLLGVAGTEEALKAELAKSSAGQIGTKLQEAVDPTLDLSRFRGTRTEVRAGQARRGSGGSVPRVIAENSRDKELNGFLGEAFVFEQFRRVLRGFDESSWVSANRARYGLPDTGSDAHGCDFIYRDLDGSLTGRQDQPECHIEVKTTTGEGGQPFPMSIAEWEKAQLCHASSGRLVYLIVRVERVRVLPSIADVLMDPHQLWAEHRLALKAQDLWVYTGNVGAAP